MRLGSREGAIGSGAGTSRLHQCTVRGGESCQRTAASPARTTSPHFRYAARAKGFSLLEVIAAIMLLAIAFTALMKVAGASINLTHHAAEYSQAAMRARSLLDSAFVGEPVRPESRSGRFDSQYRWQLDVTPWNPAGPAVPGAPTQLYQLDLAVSWGPPARPRTSHFRTLRLGGPLASGQPQASP